MSFINVKGCKLYYTVQGEGIPILFIHPPLLTHFNFEYQMKQLSKHFQVITFDIRGHGRSSFSKQTLTYPMIVEDMKKILDHLNIQRAFICGYSAGGSIALEFLLSHAERALGGILISGMSEVNDWVLKNKILIAMSLAKLKAFSVLAISIAWTNTNTKSSFWKLLKEERKGMVQNIEEYYHYSLIYNCTDKLEKIKSPVLLIYGQKDYGFYRYAKLLDDNLPHSELKWIQQAKHQLPTKSAYELNALIREFINSHKAK